MLSKSSSLKLSKEKGIRLTMVTKQNFAKVVDRIFVLTVAILKTSKSSSIKEAASIWQATVTSLLRATLNSFLQVVEASEPLV